VIKLDTKVQKNINVMLSGFIKALLCPPSPAAIFYK
jgi:hypothetical protein